MSDPTTALAVFAHPDDPEVSCGGTLARWSAGGATTHLIICTRGEKGSRDPATDPEVLAAERAEETARAVAVLGLSGHEMFDYPDGELENTTELRGRLVERIRQLRPDVVICPDPTAVYFGDGYINHHDHRAVGWAVLDACAPAASSPLYFPGPETPHLVSRLYLSGTLDPDTFVDVTEVLELKIEALRAHRTQLPDGDDLVADVVRQRAAEAGKDAGLAYAESFKQIRFT